MGDQANPGGGGQPRPGSLASRLGHDRTVLVIDDEPETARLLGAYFRASGWQVEHYRPASAADAIEKVRGHEADCVVIDAHLECDGLGVVDAVRHEPRTSSIPIVMVTSDDPAALADHAATLGAALVQKPFDVRDMFDHVTELCASPSPRAARAEPGAPEAEVLSSAELRKLLAKWLRASRRRSETTGKTVGLAVVRIRDVDGQAPAWTAVEAAARALERGLTRGQLLGCSDTDEIAVLYPNVGGDEAEAELQEAAGLIVGCVAHAGLATWPDHAGTPDELYMAADAAAAEAEEAGASVRLAR